MRCKILVGQVDNEKFSHFGRLMNHIKQIIEADSPTGCPRNTKYAIEWAEKLKALLSPFGVRVLWGEYMAKVVNELTHYPDQCTTCNLCVGSS